LRAATEREKQEKTKTKKNNKKTATSLKKREISSFLKEKHKEKKRIGEKYERVTENFSNGVKTKSLFFKDGCNRLRKKHT